MKKTVCRLCLFTGLLLLFCSGCDPGLNKITSSDPQTCEGCHINQAALQQYAAQETAVAEGGG